MECKECKYCRKNNTYDMCIITHTVLNHPIGKQYIGCNLESEKEVENADICFNCKYWIGGGDWGLSCQKNYYNCSTNGFDKTCEQFERKEK